MKYAYFVIIEFFLCLFAVCSKTQKKTKQKTHWLYDCKRMIVQTVLCASVVVEEQQRSGFLSPDRLPTLPADITNTLCTCNQEKWWVNFILFQPKTCDTKSC